jgi:hypothetical protein
MIARFTISVPFDIAVPEGVPFQLYGYEQDGYTLTPRPPTRTDVPLFGPVPAKVTVNGGPGSMVNGLVIDSKRRRLIALQAWVATHQCPSLSKPPIYFLRS